MATYIPHHLVHAHLPAPPSIPASIPELRVPANEPIPIPDEAYEEPLHPDHAVSLVHDTANNILARNIFNGYVLELRPFGPTIAKQRQNIETGSEIVRIFFPEPLRALSPGAIRFSNEEDRLFIIVISQANVVYRLNFPLGTFRQGTDDRFIFMTQGEEWLEDWEVPEHLIGACGGVGATTVLNGDTVVLGGGDGGIVIVTRSGNYSPDSGYWEATHYRASSKFRLPSLFSRSANSAEQIVSFSEFVKEGHVRIIYTLSRDRKLRAWNAETGTCLRTIGVRSSSQAVALRGSDNSAFNSEDGSVNMIRVVHHPFASSRYSHLVVTFFSTQHSASSAGSFVVFRASTNSYGISDLSLAGEKPCSPASAGSELRGLEVLAPVKLHGVDNGWRLWTVWDRDGTPVCEVVTIDDVFQFSTYIETNDPPLLSDWQVVVAPYNIERFDATYFDNLLPPTPPNPAEPEDNGDIPATFIQHLFHPGRFSTLTLQTALEDYTYQLSRKSNRAQILGPISSLSKRFGAIVGSQLEIEVSPDTGAPVVDVYRKQLKLEWLGIWASVRDLDRQSRWPVSTSTIGQSLFVLTREGVSIPVPEEAAGVVDRLGKSEIEANEFLNLPEGTLRRVYPSLGWSDARIAALSVAMSGEYIAGLLKSREAQNDESDVPSMGSLLDVLIRNINDTLSAGLQGPPELVAGSLWDDFLDPVLTEEERMNIGRILSETSSVNRGLVQCVEILEDSSFALHSSEPNSEPSSNFSGLGNALLSSTLSQIIESRYALAQNVLFTSLFYLGDGFDPLDDSEKSEELIEILTRVMVAYHRYRVLKWVAGQTGEEAGERKQAAKTQKASRSKRKLGDDGLIDVSGGSRIKEMEDNEHDTDGFTTEYSLLHCLAARSLAPEVSGSDMALNVFLQAAMDVLDQIHLLSSNQVDIAAQSPDVVFGNKIFIDGHPLLAGAYSDLYPLSSGIAYLKGRAYLEAGVLEGAMQYLEKAAAGCKDGSLAPILPSTSGPNSLSSYYSEVCDAFKAHGIPRAAARFGQLAIDTAIRGAPPTKDLWTKVFMAHLELSLYEEAYVVLTSLPFMDMKRDFLGHLISEMCEKNEVGRLNSLGFIGFQRDVEELLRFKARNSDPLRRPNYYKVLYSWHVTRGDYRSAGEVMYLQGRRFAEGSSSKYPTFELSAMQARSYLAAINALSLVEKRNAWFSVPGAPAKSLKIVKRRKMSSYIPEEEFTKGKSPVDIITLEDIQMEYTVVLSQLRISSHIPDIYDHGVAVSPQEIVGLFVQRGMYDIAQSAASSLKVDMSGLFQSLASRCVELSRLQEHAGDISAAAFLQTSPITSRLQGPPATLALHYLRVALQRHDSSQTNWRYREAVADTLFELNKDKRQGWSMPAWLVQWEMERSAEGWIGRALRWGWVSEALDWSIENLRQATPPELLPKEKSNAVYVPYNLFDRVLAAVRQNDEIEEPLVQQKAKILREEVSRRLKTLESLRAWT
ncbi:hypothetical protein LQV05_003644 [Cryptococcus neoformans]|nr:nuclear pore complex protein Nup160 [Cryptococcus neoformans var. grubii]OXC61558.1 nuclear pore complex protein Nup160 [Cryptococcus neoformans var. grubii MW-RSA852]UOH80983.1 hypothetical protein LQV05_003644 [Cryptococcus neoformans]